ncbi:hypothetical protein VTJ83DRAFT_3685 [Remersonia thermophila]|uniref:Uncharacterized protein n=1 Tax=Remersonia thermophila TaxID=72144 RepID=A0ABR4DEU9_9PEZI
MAPPAVAPAEETAVSSSAADVKPSYGGTTITALPGDPILPEGDGENAPRGSLSSAEAEAAAVAAGLSHLESRGKHWYSYLLTWDFWIIIAIGQTLALCITATNTFTSFLVSVNTNIPAFQTLLNYALMTLIWLPVTLYRHGPRRWARVVWKDGWRYLILSFFDVEGNYFTVLAYNYTNILSAQLINFWAIVCVVVLSFLLLGVRYRLLQLGGILLCCGGMGVLLASDHLTGANGGQGRDMLKGDLFALAGATFYGFANVYEEWFVSKRPVYEVLSFLGVFGVCINGVQWAIFDRRSFEGATWNGQVAGWLVGYMACLCLFYSLAPLVLRMGSAAVFGVNLLTGNFWGVIIGTRVFGLSVHWMYPIAFVLILCGQVVYFVTGSVLGDSKKPWLGEDQRDGVAGIGTAKRKALAEAKKKGLVPAASGEA